MPATFSKPIPRLFSPILFFAGSNCSCESYSNSKCFTYFSFSVWPPATVNILNFLLHAMDGLGGGYRRNTLRVHLTPYRSRVTVAAFPVHPTPYQPRATARAMNHIAVAAQLRKDDFHSLSLTVEPQLIKRLFLGSMRSSRIV